MTILYTKTLEVPRTARNGRIYADGTNNNSNTSTSSGGAILDWADVTISGVTINRDLKVTGNIEATKEVIAWVASGVTTDVLNNLTATYPLEKTTSSNIILKYDSNQFEIVNNSLQIKSSILGSGGGGISLPIAISGVTNLQSTLDNKWSASNHPTTVAGYGLPAYPTSLPASDVYNWAKASTKPDYNYNEVGAASSSHSHAGTYEPVITKGNALQYFKGDMSLGTLPTSLPASDVYTWAKASTKPAYNWTEINNRPTALSSFTNDSGFISTKSDVENVLTGFISSHNHNKIGTKITASSYITLGSLTNGDTVHITGTTTIYNLGTSTTGFKKTVIFDDALTLVYNATSLILPNYSNLTVGAKDVAEFLCEDGVNG